MNTTLVEYSEDDYLLLSGIQHFTFCPRQWALIHVENIWEESFLTASGRVLHNRVHDGNSFEKRGDLVIFRALKISSRALGISGECDVVEFHKSDDGVKLNKYDGKWLPYPIEYKRGDGLSIYADEMQLCAQAICLEEMLCCHIPAGALYYGQPKRRKEIVFTQELRDRVAAAMSEMHMYFARRYTPKAVYTKSCDACSLKDACLPAVFKKSKAVQEYIISGLDDEETP
ncbi:MAG TPA: CRISPR-associated protein Cas4 [Eubacteriales bacterium]|nr:CRISPR-associated protein Cas4 [Eubacteriales bacterium]HRU84688.1 CRISPR-associated protein Cas4 [Eubacteriales bacterium]